MFDDVYEEVRNIPCMFCGEIVNFGNEGLVGVQVGKRAICSGCLPELKEVLGIESRY
jgi:hypothetical protein